MTIERAVYLLTGWNSESSYRRTAKLAIYAGVEFLVLFQRPEV